MVLRHKTVMLSFSFSDSFSRHYNNSKLVINKPYEQMQTVEDKKYSLYVTVGIFYAYLYAGNSIPPSNDNQLNQFSNQFNIVITLNTLQTMITIRHLNHSDYKLTIIGPLVLSVFVNITHRWPLS